jgi:hypothetical protein
LGLVLTIEGQPLAVATSNTFEEQRLREPIGSFAELSLVAASALPPAVNWT